MSLSSRDRFSFGESPKKCSKLSDFFGEPSSAWLKDSHLKKRFASLIDKRRIWLQTSQRVPRAITSMPTVSFLSPALIFVVLTMVPSVIQKMRSTNRVQRALDQIPASFDTLQVGAVFEKTSAGPSSLSRLFDLTHLHRSAANSRVDSIATSSKSQSPAASPSPIHVPSATQPTRHSPVASHPNVEPGMCVLI